MWLALAISQNHNHLQPGTRKVCLVYIFFLGSYRVAWNLLLYCTIFFGVSRRTCPGDESNAISTDETLEVEGIQCALTKEDELVMCLGFKPLKNGGWKTILTFPFGEAI